MYGSSDSHSFFTSTSPSARRAASARRRCGNSASVTAPCGRLASRTWRFVVPSCVSFVAVDSAAKRSRWCSASPNCCAIIVRRRNVWLTLSSSLMPMPPCSWIDSWLTWRQASAIRILAADTTCAARCGSASVSTVAHARLGHRLRLLVADHHVDHAVLQRLERADRHAELLARLQVVERRVVGVADRAHGLGADQRGREVDDFLDQRQRRALDADERIGARRARCRSAMSAARSAVERPIAVHATARARRVDEEEADAVAGRRSRPRVRADTTSESAPRAVQRRRASRRRCT